MTLYPLKFKPLYKERVWGGNKMATVLGRKIKSEKPIGESWDLSSILGDLSVVSNGFLEGNNIEELIEIYMADLVGEKVYSKFGVEFPLLFKFIDSSQKLSVQVHPNDEVSKDRHSAYGKTEMWYVVDADKDAVVYIGFNKDMTEEEYKERIANGTLLEVINVEKANVGDVFYLPAGRIHSIGEGILIAEIQQASDVTYRIHDWGRESNKQTAREMHTDLSINAIDYKLGDDYRAKYTPEANKPVKLITNEYFTTNILDIDKPKIMDYTKLDSFVVYMCIEGSAVLDCDDEIETITKGETILIPASIQECIIKPDKKVKLLEVYTN